MKIKYIVEKLEQKNIKNPSADGIWYIVKPQHKILDIIDKIFPIYFFLGIERYDPYTNLEQAIIAAKTKTEGKDKIEINHGTVYDPTPKKTTNKTTKPVDLKK